MVATNITVPFNSSGMEPKITLYCLTSNDLIAQLFLSTVLLKLFHLGYIVEGQLRCYILMQVIVTIPVRNP